MKPWYFNDCGMHAGSLADLCDGLGFYFHHNPTLYSSKDFEKSLTIFSSDSPSFMSCLCGKSSSRVFIYKPCFCFNQRTEPVSSRIHASRAVPMAIKFWHLVILAVIRVTRGQEHVHLSLGLMGPTSKSYAKCQISSSVCLDSQAAAMNLAIEQARQDRLIDNTSIT